MWSHVGRDLQDCSLSSGHGQEAFADPRVRAAKEHCRRYWYWVRGSTDDGMEVYGSYCAAGGVSGAIQGSFTRNLEGSPCKCRHLFGLFADWRSY